jgi:HSP20 family molecular chaperone IbpA
MINRIPWTQIDGGPVAPFGNETDPLYRLPGKPPEERPAPAPWPRVEVRETEKEFLVRIDPLGTDPKVIGVRVVGEALVVYGQRKEEHEAEGKGRHSIERLVAEFYHAVVLPPGAEDYEISATAPGGVVTVTFPKGAAAEPAGTARAHE